MLADSKTTAAAAAAARSFRPDDGQQQQLPIQPSNRTEIVAKMLISSSEVKKLAETSRLV